MKSLIYAIIFLTCFNLHAEENKVIIEGNTFRAGSTEQVVVTGCYGDYIHPNLAPSIKKYQISQVNNGFHVVVVEKSTVAEGAIRSAIVQIDNLEISPGHRYSYGLEVNGADAKVWLVDDQTNKPVSNISEFKLKPYFKTTKKGTKVPTTCTTV